MRPTSDDLPMTFAEAADTRNGSRMTEGPIRILKHGDTFAVFDHSGNINAALAGEDGVYHDGTRFVSRLTVELDGVALFFLSSTVRSDNGQLTVALTNPDLR